jgi:hypothetical protein
MAPEKKLLALVSGAGLRGDSRLGRPRGGGYEQVRATFALMRINQQHPGRGRVGVGVEVSIRARATLVVDLHAKLHYTNSGSQTT